MTDEVNVNDKAYEFIEGADGKQAQVVFTIQPPPFGIGPWDVVLAPGVEWTEAAETFWRLVKAAAHSEPTPIPSKISNDD